MLPDEAKLPLMGPRPPKAKTRRTTSSTIIIFTITALGSLLAMFLLHALLSLGTCALASGSSCYKGYESPYSFDAGLARHPRWMAAVPDDAHLSGLSIPGTHDTMTYGMPGSRRLQCQNHNLSSQLGAGLRYFDIRGRLVNDTIGIYHSYAYTGYTLADVALEMFAFLDANPTEAIVMRLKQEGGPVGGEAKARNRTFEEVFNEFRLANPDTAPGFARHLFAAPGGKGGPQSAFLPTMGDARGKILLLEEFPAATDAHYGLLWDSDLMRLQDLWQIPTVGHLDDKWAAVEESLDLARRRPDDNAALYVSHLSASFGVLPIEAAAGPLDESVEGINDRMGAWLRREDTGGRTGVVIIDFPGRDLVDLIIGRNGGLEEDEVII